MINYDALVAEFWNEYPQQSGYNPHFGIIYMAINHLFKDKKISECADCDSLINNYAQVHSSYYKKGILWLDSLGLIDISIIDDKPKIKLLSKPFLHKENDPIVIDFYSVKKRPKRNGFVYLFYSQSQSLYKIGFAKDVEIRLSQLMKVDASIQHILNFPGTLSLEKSLHERFDHKRRHSEWFDLDHYDVRSLCNFNCA